MVAPDLEATDHRPRACGVRDLVKRLDEPAIHRRQYELLHCQATSAPGTAGSIERQSPRISRPLAEVDRTSAATTGWARPSLAEARTRGAGAIPPPTTDYRVQGRRRGLPNKC